MIGIIQIINEYFYAKYYISQNLLNEEDVRIFENENK